MFTMDLASQRSTCGLCLKTEITTIDSRTSSQCYSNDKLCSMLDIFKLPAHFAAPSSFCEECSKQLQSAYSFHQNLLGAIGSIPAEPAPSVETSPVDPGICQKLLYPCDTCNLNFENNLTLKRHRKLVHVGIVSHHYYCQHCHKTFKTNRGLEQHSTYCHKSDTQQFRCEQCLRDFTTKTNYINHLACHVDFLCRFCDHGWSNQKKLLEHVRNDHKNRLFVCKRCSKTESLRKCLNRHLRSAHNVQQNEYYCGHCSNDSSFKDVVTLNEHFQKDHKSLEDNGGDYAELLNETFFPRDIALEFEAGKSKQEDSKDDFLKHLNLVRIAESSRCGDNPKENILNPNKMILEEFLDEAFENDQIWTKYIEGGEEYLIDNYDFYLDGQTTEGIVKYKCPRCGEGFVKQALLTIHLAETHSISCLVCNDCGANFNKLLEYRTHRQEHLKDNARFVENIIPEAEEALSLVQQEDKEYTVCEKGSTYVYTCKLCDRTFSKKCNLGKHKCAFYAEMEAREDGTFPSANSIPSGDPTLPDSLFCTLCDKKFTSISGLKYHLKRHTDIKAFACVYCSKKFTANSNLNAHIRQKHSESKSHACPECDQSFACKDHLTKHIRSKHRQERAFACPECPKSYFQKSHLNDHVAASHMGYKAFVCELCSTSYSCRGSLRRHVAKHHKGQGK